MNRFRPASDFAPDNCAYSSYQRLLRDDKHIWNCQRSRAQLLAAIDDLGAKYQ